MSIPYTGSIYLEYRAYREAPGSWSVALFSVLSGDRKDIVDTGLSASAARAEARRLNRKMGRR